LLVLYPLMPNATLAIIGQALAVFLGTLGFGPGIAAFQVITPNRMRAQVSSLSQFSTNVVAFALSPLIVAGMTDYVFKDPGALNLSMSLSALIMGSLALIVTIQGMKPYGRAYEHAVRENF
jgi:MFS family permease